MNRKFEPGSEESIDLIIESLRMVGIECRKVESGEEGGLFFRDENGERKKFTDNIFVKRSIKYDQLLMKELTIPLSELNNEPIEQELVSDTVELFHATLDVNPELIANISDNILDVRPIITTNEYHSFDPSISKILDAA